MEIREYLSRKKLLCDGAFGTYFSEKKLQMLPEQANLLAPETVKQVHLDYIQAGARLIRTNTFASNTYMLGCSREEQRENIRAAVRIAREAAAESGEEVFVAGDIGPVEINGTGAGGAAWDASYSDTSYSDTFDASSSDAGHNRILEEYANMVRTFLEEGVRILVFETFADYEVLLEVLRRELAERNKGEKHDIFVILQFSVDQHGYTQAGISAKRLMAELSDCPLVDAVGFNCGVGPGHMIRILEGLVLPEDKFVTALPNASYPRIQKGRMVFLENQEYFAEKMTEMSYMGVDILGGCCGTTPDYIRRVRDMADFRQQPEAAKRSEKETASQAPNRMDKQPAEQSDRKSSAFYAGKAAGKKLLAVELAPPFHADDEKVLDGAHYLAARGVDVVTHPDSPSGRTRADSITTAIKVMHHTGLCVMPHICCRDKNTIAMRAQLLGGYLNGIRNLLVVTGDPIPSMMRGDIRSVFNFDSVGLMKLIREMNEDEFADDPVVYGGAINHNRRNLDVEISRMEKKLDAGASFFLTQPMFTEEEAKRLRAMKQAVPKARILCGIMPLISHRNATFIRNEMAGIQVTEEIVKRYREDMSRTEGEAVGVAIAKEVMQMTEDFADGYYFSIPFNRVYLLDQIINIKI